MHYSPDEPDFRPRRLISAMPPVAEPLTLAEVKTYLRIDHTAEDGLLDGMVAAARQAAEQYLRRSLITQGWKLVYADWMPSCIRLPMGPVQGVTGVKIVRSDGSEDNLAMSAYHFDQAAEAVAFSAMPFGHRIELTYLAGFGDAATDVPAALRQGMLSHVAGLYDRRLPAAGLPPQVVALYEPYRIPSL